MKRYKIYLIILLLIVNISSCKKSFLDVEDNSVILAEQYVKDLNTTQHYLNGIYVILGRDFYHGYNQIYPDLIADNIKPKTGSAILASQYTWQQVAIVGSGNGSSAMNFMWQTGYQLARSCSFVIEKASEFKGENLDQAKQLQAEAYSLRALVHFVMVNIFAQSYNYSLEGAHIGIPYVTNIDWTKNVTRNSVNEVYTAIINDINNAIPLFTNSNRNTLVMSQISDKALLARIYLYKEDWQNAKSLSVEVANVAPLMTGSLYPSKLFTLQETEALFQISPSSNLVMTSGYNTLFQGRFFNNKTSTSFFATADIATLLRQNSQDIRRNWVKSNGANIDTIIKFPVNVVAGFNPVASSYYPTLLRSSEMFLIASEASAKLGDEETARNYLDAIRKRADPSATNSIATGTALMDLIHLERRKELAFEGLRMFDLLRWKEGVNRTDITTGASKTLPYPSGRALAPIPLTDVANGILQNDGY